MKPAIFLDRDGVLTVERSYVCSVDEMEIFAYSDECVRIIHDKGYYAIVITNQSGIARGFFSEDELIRMNLKLTNKTNVDAIYYCPHHPEGIIERYRIKCACRKPGTELIERACRDYSIDLSKSYMVGDRFSDIQLGKNAGITTVLLESGYGTKGLEGSIAPDYIENNLLSFVMKL